MSEHVVYESVEPTKETKIVLLSEIMNAWINTRFNCEIQHKVQSRLGNKDALKKIEKDLADCEIAIHLINEEISKLN